METKVKAKETRPFSTGAGYMMREAHKAMSRLLAPALAAEGIAFKHYFYLRTLYEEDGISQIEVGERVGVDRGTVTRVLETMERDGWIMRKADPYDGRKTIVYLTPSAKVKREKVLRVIQTVNRQVLRGLTDADIRHFYAVVEKIMENVNEVDQA